MDTLMRTLKFLLLAVILVGLGSPAYAQAPVQIDWTGRGYFHVSVAGQAKDQTFNDSSTFTIYNERGAVASAQSIGGGTMFDIAAGARVWRNFGVGLGWSSVENKNDAFVSVRVPHPLVFGASREAGATADDLKHSENAVHLSLVWMMRLTDRIQLAVMGGPSFFTVRQEIATVRAPQDIRDVAPFTSVSITSVTVTEVKDSPVGGHIGIDGTYMITPMIGVGVFARYAGASLDLPVEAGVTRDEGLSTGGPQGGIGLRLRF
jgi:hypothetical protein